LLRRWDETLLCSYVDGELNEVEHAAVEELLVRDPAARQQVSLIRELNMLLRVAYRDKALSCTKK
jgi:anti-sigma factor RsiW